MVVISFVIKLHLWLLPQNWVLVSLVRYHQLPLMSQVSVGECVCACAIYVQNCPCRCVRTWFIQHKLPGTPRRFLLCSLPSVDHRSAHRAGFEVARGWDSLGLYFWKLHTLYGYVFLYKLHETSIASALLLIVQLEWGNSSGWAGHGVWKYLHQYSLFSYISKINNNVEVLLLLVINFDLCGKRGQLIQLCIY